MYIHEAIKKAIEKKCYIIRKGESIKIKPTNTYAHCILYHFENGHEVDHCNNWNAPAMDLMANDWELAD